MTSTTQQHTTAAEIKEFSAISQQLAAAYAEPLGDHASLAFTRVLQAALRAMPDDIQKSPEQCALFIQNAVATISADETTKITREDFVRDNIKDGKTIIRYAAMLSAEGFLTSIQKMVKDRLNDSALTTPSDMLTVHIASRIRRDLNAEMRAGIADYCEANPAQADLLRAIALAVNEGLRDTKADILNTTDEGSELYVAIATSATQTFVKLVRARISDAMRAFENVKLDKLQDSE